MKKMYVGTKLINAVPMNRQEYNDFRGWKLPEDEDGSDEGYLVEYLDGGKPNTEQYDGYVSWSPVQVFKNAYQASEQLSFGHAVELMKLGYKVARSGWNGKRMFVFLVQGSQFKVNRKPLIDIFDENTIIDYQSHIDMKTADNTIVPWLASQSDVLSNDWGIVD